MTPLRIIVKKDQPYSFHGIQGGTRRLCITKVSFEPPHSSMTKCNHIHAVSCKVGDQCPIVLCIMVTKLGLTTDLHVEFQECENVLFSTTGYRAIRLVGYFKETVKYLTHNHLQQLLNFSPLAAKPSATDKRIGEDQNLEKLALSDLDTFQGELNSTGPTTNKEPENFDLVLQNEITNGTTMDIDETPKDIELKKHYGSAEKNEVSDLNKNEANGLDKNEVIDVISKCEVLQSSMTEFKTGEVTMAKKYIEPEFYYGNLGSFNLEELDRLHDKDLDALILRQNETLQKMHCVLPDKGDKIRLTINHLEDEKKRRKLGRLEQEVHDLNDASVSIKQPDDSSSESQTHSLFTSLLIKEQPVVIVDEEGNDQITDAVREITLCYPSRHCYESVEISNSEMACLAPRASLTSTIMNFYIRYLEVATVVDKERSDGYHFFNTYLYGKLKETLSYQGSDPINYFMQFRRWWKGVNIFQKAYVFIPIHEFLHWSLVIICMSESGPIILHMDSLKLHGSQTIFNTIRTFIRKEWNYLKQEVSPSDVPIAEKIWNNMPSGVDEKIIEVPQQKNSYDCGLFVLYFMERFVEEAPDRLKKKDLVDHMFGKQWFQPEEASDLRRKILLELMQEFMQ